MLRLLFTVFFLVTLIQGVQSQYQSQDERLSREAHKSVFNLMENPTGKLFKEAVFLVEQATNNDAVAQSFIEQDTRHLVSLIKETRESDLNYDQLDARIISFIEGLQNKGVTKIGYAKSFCIGRIYFPDSEEDECSYTTNHYSMYLFWEEDNHAFAKKFDHCGAFKQVTLPQSDFLDFYFSHRQLIEQEQVKWFGRTKTREDGSVITLMVSPAHSCHWHLTVYDEGREMNKRIDVYDLLEEDKMGSNINYQYNNNLKLVEWMRLVKELTDQMEKEGVFEKR